MDVLKAGLILPVVVAEVLAAHAFGGVSLGQGGVQGSSLGHTDTGRHSGWMADR